MQKFKSVRAGGGCDVARGELFGVWRTAEKRVRESACVSKREREEGAAMDCKCAAVCVEQDKYCCRQHSQKLSMAFPKSKVRIF